jgi:hypothetical protein
VELEGVAGVALVPDELFDADVVAGAAVVLLVVVDEDVVVAAATVAFCASAECSNPAVAAPPMARAATAARMRMWRGEVMAASWPPSLWNC